MENAPSPDATAVPIKTGQVNTLNSWVALGFSPETNADGATQAAVPAGLLIIAAATPEGNKPLGVLCQSITDTAPVLFNAQECTHYVYRLDKHATMPATLALPEGVKVLAAGAVLTLPDTPMFGTEPPLLGTEALASLAGPTPDPTILNSPLSEFSLRGKADEFELQAVKAKPLLGGLCLSGQATVWYAPPNSGKTLIVLKLLSDAVAEGRINPDNVYYINADDSSEGFATKMRLMDDLGVHTLAPGYQGFQTSRLPDLFREMVERKKAKGAVVIIDTIKKVASLMDKGKTSVFTDACRSAVMAGATIVGFAHTNKQPQANGKLQYGGTTDLRDDFDAAYLMGPIEIDGFDGEKVVSFECIKARGGNAQSATYVYADSEGVPYTERLASVRLVDAKELQGFRRIEEAKADAEVIEAIEACIREGGYAKMALAKAASKRTGISERAAIRMIEKYTGTDPTTAKWSFQRKDRGAMIYVLVAEPEAEVPDPAVGGISESQPSGHPTGEIGTAELV